MREKRRKEQVEIEGQRKTRLGQRKMARRREKKKSRMGGDG